MKLDDEQIRRVLQKQNKKNCFYRSGILDKKSYEKERANKIFSLESLGLTSIDQKCYSYNSIN